MELKRVVVTGLGALTPIGNTKDEYWNGLVNGKSGAAPITHFDAEKFKTQFACEIKNFEVTDFIDRKCWRSEKHGKKVDWSKIDPEAHAVVLFDDGVMRIPVVDLEVVNKRG